MRRQTYVAKESDVVHEWCQISAEGWPLGRLAARLAVILQGKHKPQYTPHVDTGDYVIVTNAEKIVLTGKKREQRFKTSFSGYPGGLRVRSYGDLLDKFPERVIEDAVKRMLPKGPLGRKMALKLKVFRGPDHPHQAQRPVALE